MVALQFIPCSFFLFVPAVVSEILGRACESGNLTITCSDTPNTTLHILWAHYGRTSTDYCYEKGPTSTYCAACNSSSIVAGLCQYEVSCTINASNTMFGDPCHGIYKYLEVGYECREPGMQTYECYDWTHEDIAHFWINCTHDSELEEATCVDHPGYIFTEGNETLAPGCGGCFCCKPTVTQNYECRHWTYSDKVKFLVNCTHHPRLERPTCERYPGYIYTRGDNTLAPGCGSCSCCKPTDTYSSVCPENTSSTSMISTSSATTTSTFNRTSPTAPVSFLTSLSTTLVTTISSSYPPSSENKISSSTVASPWNTLSLGHSSSPSTIITSSTIASNALTTIASSHSSPPANNTSSSTGASTPTTTITSSHLSSPNNIITNSTATSPLISLGHSSSPNNVITSATVTSQLISSCHSFSRNNMITSSTTASTLISLSYSSSPSNIITSSTVTSNSIVTVSPRHSSSLRNIITSSSVTSDQETALSTNYPSTTETVITSSTDASPLVATTSFSRTSSSKYMIPSSIVAPSQVPMTKGDLPDFFNDPTNIAVVSTAAGVAGFLAIFVTVYILVRQRSKIKYLCTKGNTLRHSNDIANR